MVASRLFTALMLLALPALARAQRFASVVIKTSSSNAPGASRLQILPNGDLIGHSVSVVELMSLAYAIPENPSPRLSSLPDWAVRQPFDIEAKASSSLKLDTKDIQSQRQTIRILLQELLKDYFGLVITARTSTTPIYALRLSRNDQTLTRSKLRPTVCILDTGPDGCHSFAIGFGHPLNATGVDMADLALYLENWTDLPVVDRTATEGLFAMHSQGWQPMNLPPPPPGASSTGVRQPLNASCGPQRLRP
jgi:uncharacterized protein (TIGR03435 family)